MWYIIVTDKEGNLRTRKKFLTLWSKLYLYSKFINSPNYEFTYSPSLLLYSFYEKSVVAKRLRSFRYMPTRAVLCCCCFKIIKEVFDNAGMRMYVLAKRTNITDDSRKKVEKATKKWCNISNCLESVKVKPFMAILRMQVLNSY